MRGMPQDSMVQAGIEARLTQQAEEVIVFLKRMDKRWDGSTEPTGTGMVRLCTIFGEKRGPSLRIAGLRPTPLDQAQILHEAMVGRSVASKDRKRVETTNYVALARRAASRREKRANDPEWRRQENKKRQARKDRAAARAQEVKVGQSVSESPKS